MIFASKKRILILSIGKINFSETIKNAVERKRLLSCEYDELSENTTFNRIIKSTAILLIKHKGVSNKYRDQLKKEMLFFSNVDSIDLKSVRWAVPARRIPKAAQRA